MSKNKKRKPARKVSPETWKNVKLGLSTIISNEGCIRSAREFHGPVSVIVPVALALVSVVLAVLPTFVTQMNSKQSDYVFANPSANYEAGLAQFLQNLVLDDEGHDRNLALSIAEDGSSYNMLASDIATLNGGEQWYTVERITDDGTKAKFEVFFNTTTDVNDVDFFSRIDQYRNPFTGNYRDNSGSETIIKEFQSSYLAFGKETIRFRKRSDSKAFSGITGTYARIAGYNFTALAKELVGTPATSATYLNRVRSEFVDIANLSTQDAKVAATWQYTGIFAGVDLGLIVLFGLIMFLMTRGKKNPFRVFTFWETQKMSYWAAFTPALISMVIGFFMVNYAMLFFMFTFGMRMMWMSMRSLRPQQ